MVSANQAWNLVNFRGGLIEALRTRGFAITAVAPPDRAYEARLRVLGCDVAPIEIDAKGMSPLRDAQLVLRYAAIMRRVRPAAYLSWTIKPNIYGAIAARTLGIAALPNVSGLGTAFIRTNPLTEIVSLLYRTGFARASSVFFQNADDAAIFRARRLVRDEQVTMLRGSGIDTRHFAPATGERLARGHFLMIARVLADKGVREFVEAARILKREDPRRRFTILGHADVANRTAIPRAELDAWVAEGAIEWMAPVDDVRDTIMASDCVVLPSYREGTSRVLLEGAAMARPLVASDVPGCREVVDDAVTGFLAPVRDATALAAAMRRVDRLDDAAWRRMGMAGRRKVSEEFSPETVVGAYLAALARAGVR